METERRTGNGPLTLNDAAGRYWNEVGQHHRDNKGTYHAIELLIKHFGPNRRLRRNRRCRRLRVGRMASATYGQGAGQKACVQRDREPQRGRTAPQAVHPRQDGLALPVPARAPMAQAPAQGTARTRARASRGEKPTRWRARCVPISSRGFGSLRRPASGLPRRSFAGNTTIGKPRPSSRSARAAGWSAHP